MIDVRQAVIAHLQLLEEWGVAGFSRDPLWTRRDESAAMSRDGFAPEVLATPSGPAQAGAAPTRPTAVAPAVSADRAAALAQLRADIGDCTRCKLHRLGRRQIVYGVGNPNAKLMFVGEAPGEDEDIQGFPFVGRAGQLLTKIIEAMGLTRDGVYIANVIKCRPPGNRNPEPDEVATCEPFLFRQIDIIQPSVIVALGTFAAKTLLQTTSAISRLRGRAYEYRGSKLVPTFHPAFLLRSPGFKRDTWEDMKIVMAILQEPSTATITEQG
jgi:DNA polymerase